MTRSGWIMVAAIAIGLAIAIWTLDFVGLQRTIALLAAVRPDGLVLLLLVQGAVQLTLGMAWSSSMSGESGRVLTFAWARTVREAANDLLPFSQIGGLVLGLKVLTDAGIRPARAYAATVIDLTTELASQLLLVLCSIAISIELVAAIDPHFRLAIWAGVAILALLVAGALLLRGPVLAFAGRIGDRMLPAAGAMIGEVRAELAAFETRRGAILAPFLWNAAAWLLSMAFVWLALALLGHGLPPQRVLALEALISVVRSSAFLVPGAVGVQEVGYVLIGAIVGLDPNAAMALSLLKRARDVVLGVPTLLIWQASVLRRRSRGVADRT